MSAENGRNIAILDEGNGAFLPPDPDAMRRLVRGKDRRLVDKRRPSTTRSTVRARRRL
jgi:hypothetical protein